VVPSAQADPHFGGSSTWLADTAWSISLRLLRCEGAPFDEQEMLAAHRASAFAATAVGAAAALVADGADIDVTAFDSCWHWESIAAQTIAAQAAQTVG
jgi:hypothetical protein